MSKKINGSKIEEFWDDCIKNELQKKNKKDKNRLTIIESNSCINFNIINNVNKSRKNNQNLKKHKLLLKVLSTEESKPKILKKKRGKANRYINIII